LSYNSYRGGVNKTKRILKVLRESETPLKPSEIAFFAKVNHSTTRVYLRRLLAQGEVTQPFPQVYVTKTIHGVVGDFVRVHNLVLGVDAPGLSRGIRGFEGWFGAVKLRVVFGARRGKITGFVSCDEGMDFDKTVLVMDKFKQIVFERTGAKISDGEVNVVTCELNEDRQDIRLDGLKSVTVKDFVGSLERIYNKGGGLRSEVKVKPQSIEHIYGVLKGGMTPYQILQGIGLLTSEIKELKEVMKFNNRLQANILSVLKENGVK
jgi:hypothetical protein